MKKMIKYFEEKKRLTKQKVEREGRKNDIRAAAEAEAEIEEMTQACDTAKEELQQSLSEAEQNFFDAMEDEDEILAEAHENALIFIQDNLQTCKELSTQVKLIAINHRTNANMIGVVKGLGRVVDKVGAQAGKEDGADIVVEITSIKEDIARLTQESKLSLSAIRKITPKAANTDENKKRREAMRKRHAAMKAVRGSGINATEGDDKEITDILSSLGNPVGSS